MSLKTQMAADFANVVLNTDEFAESVAYTAPDGTITTCTAMWIPREAVTEYEEDIGRRSRRREGDLYVSNDPAEGIALPVVDAAVQVGGEAYKVAAVGELEAGVWTLLLRRVDVIEQGATKIRV